MWQKVKSAVAARLPVCLRRAAARVYYPWLVARFDPRRWPPYAIVRLLVGRGECVVDAGANVGYVSRIFSRLVGESGKVVSIEPVPETYRILRENVRLLRMRNVITVNCAVGEREGRVRMELPRYASGAENYYESRIVSGTGRGGRVVEVRLRPLSSVVAAAGCRPDFIKIDVEGVEVAVIAGALDLIGRDRPGLLIESSGEVGDADTPLGRLVEMLGPMGYRVWGVTDGGRLTTAGAAGSGDFFFLTEDRYARLGGEVFE